MIEKIKQWVDNRRKLRELRIYNEIYMNKILVAVSDLIDGKEGLITLLNSFEGMTAEEIRDRFLESLAEIVHNEAEKRRSEQE